MIAAVGLAMGALSTVSSLIDQAATSVSNAVASPPPVQPFVAGPAASAKKPGLPAITLNPGPPLPRFDRHTHAALLAAQETLNA